MKNNRIVGIGLLCCAFALGCIALIVTLRDRKAGAAGAGKSKQTGLAAVKSIYKNKIQKRVVKDTQSADGPIDWVAQLVRSVSGFKRDILPWQDEKTQLMYSNLQVFSELDPSTLNITNYVQSRKWRALLRKIPVNGETYYKLLACHSNMLEGLTAQNQRYYMLGNMGRIARRIGDYDRAIEYYTAERDNRDIDDVTKRAYEENLADIALIYHKLYQEEKLLELGKDLSVSKDDYCRMMYYKNLMIMYCDMGEFDKARQAADDGARAIDKSSSFYKGAQNLKNMIEMWDNSPPVYPEYCRAKERYDFQLRMGLNPSDDELRRLEKKQEVWQYLRPRRTKAKNKKP